MRKTFKPDWCLLSAYHITPEQLQEHGIEAVLVDLDNTLIAWNNPEGTPEMKQWLQRLKAADIPVIVVSNNTKKRVSTVANKLGIDYVSDAKKPTKIGLSKALSKLGLPAEKVVIVGDQLLTDILGGYLLGLRTVLVKPIVDHDMLATKLNRKIEYLIKRRLSKTYDLSWQDRLH